jgi:agmatinase
MTSSQVMTFLEELAPLNFVGMDCVEVAPAYDHAELTSNAAAQFIWTYLCGQIARQAPTLAASRVALSPEGALASGRPGGETSI